MAVALREWLPYLSERYEPWMSDEDIPAPGRWSGHTGSQLEETDAGILCLAPNNLHSDWLLFEAGALAKKVPSTRICTYLCNLEPGDIPSPLGLFQSMRADEKGTWQLVKVLNRARGDDALNSGRVAKVFEQWWPELRTSLDEIGSLQPGDPLQLTESELLREILAVVRGLDSRVRGFDRQGPKYGYADLTTGQGLDELDRLGFPGNVLRAFGQAADTARVEETARLFKRLADELAPGTQANPERPAGAQSLEAGEDGETDSQ